MTQTTTVLKGESASLKTSDWPPISGGLPVLSTNKTAYSRLPISSPPSIEMEGVGIEPTDHSCRPHHHVTGRLASGGQHE